MTRETLKNAHALLASEIVKPYHEYTSAYSRLRALLFVILKLRIPNSDACSCWNEEIYRSNASTIHSRNENACVELILGEILKDYLQRFPFHWIFNECYFNKNVIWDKSYCNIEIRNFKENDHRFHSLILRKQNCL